MPVTLKSPDYAYSPKSAWPNIGSFLSHRYRLNAPSMAWSIKFVEQGELCERRIAFSPPYCLIRIGSMVIEWVLKWYAQPDA